MAHIKKMVLSQKLWRKLAIAVGVLLFVWGGLWLVLPSVIAQQIESRASQALGRAVTVQSVDVSPWSLSVAVHGLQVAGLPGQAPALSVDRTYINASLSSVLRWAPVLDAVELDRPVVRVVQEASGRWDFADVLERLQENAEPEAPDAAPARVALYNIQIRDGSVELNDQVFGVQHSIQDLQLQLPFISTLPSQREVKVQPKLSLRLNGSEIATQAIATPFDAAHTTQAKLEIKQFDLAPYAPYVPSSWPVRLQQGQMNADILVSFEQAEQATVQLQGSSLELSDLRLQDREGALLAGWGGLKVVLGDTRPLQHQVHISEVTLQQPFGDLYRRANGEFLPVALDSVPKAQAQRAFDASEAQTSSVDWTVFVDQVNVQGGSVNWRDDAGQVHAAMRVDHFDLQVQKLAWPLGDDAQWQLQAQLQNADGAARGNLHSAGQGSLDVGQATVVIDKLDAQAFQAYAKQWLQLPVAGFVSLNAGVAWKHGRVHAVVPTLNVDAVALGAAKLPDLAWTRLQLRNLELDTEQQQAQVAHMALDAPLARVHRNAQGQWMFEQWLHPVAGSSAQGKSAGAPAEGKPWHVVVQDMALVAGQVELTDASLGSRPLAIKLSDVQLRLQNVDSLKGTAQAKLSARMAERTRRGVWGGSGGLSYDGDLQLAPLLVKGRVQLNALPLQAFEPYIGPHLNVRLVRALASLDANVQFTQQEKGPQVRLQGQGRITDLYVQSVAGDEAAAQAVQGPGASAALGAEDLLRWKQLRLQGLLVSLQPEQPLSVRVHSTDLDDFYARVVVLPEGRLNLQNLVKSAQQDAQPTVPVEASVAAQEGGSSLAPAVPEAPAARIDMGPIALHGGVIKFSDYFIKPNYTAELTALNGTLAAFSSHPAAAGEAPALAKLTLQGIAQGTAQLTVDGEINPLAQPLALDVRAQVHGLDLSPLTPYAIKYAGHGIEKGKLSMDVRYQVQPDGRLTASNQLVLNQLTFTEPVAGAPTSLPVRLAVALLADSNGVIDLNLPINGSLNDPQFRIAPVIFKIIGNIIRKAITAPFSLLAGAFASDNDQSDIRFEAGRASLDAQAQTNLQQLAKAMNSKSQLKLTLTGQVDPATEAQGWKQSKLEQLERGAEQEGEDGSTRSDKQKLAALKQVYRKTVKDRPRNLVGLTKDVPADEMRALIVQNMEIPATAWQDLAAARVQSVRDYLLAQGVDPQRIFLSNKVDQTENPVSPSVLLNISVQ